MLNFRLVRLLISSLLLTFGVAASSYGSTLLELSPTSSSFKYLAVTEQNEHLTQIIALPDSQWQPVAASKNFGLITHDYWLKITLDLRQYQASNQLLLFKINNPLIDNLSVHFAATPKNNSSMAQATPVYQQAIASHYFVYQIPQQRDDLTTIYVRYNGQAPIYLHTSIDYATDYIQDINQHVILMGIVIGLLLLATFYSALGYVATAKGHYLYLSCYLVTALLLITTLNGYSSLYLWNEFSWLKNSVIPSSLALTLYFALKHSSISLHFSAQPQINNKMIKWLGICLLTIAAVSTVSSVIVSVIVTIASSLITVLVITGYIALLSYQRMVNAKYHLLAWSLLSLGLVIGLATFVGLLNSSLSAQTAISLGVSAQIVIFFLLITVKFIKDRQLIITNRSDAQSKLQHFIKQRELELEHQEHSQQDLEAIVDERTFELNMTLRELQETNKRLEEQTTVDALTGVKNRKFFDQRYHAEQRLSRRQRTPITLLLLDADKFKLVNDTYGHIAGDQVLIEICQRISAILKRPNDYICRYGGEEFAILLPNTDSDGAYKIAELIRQKIAATSIKADADQINVTVSIGISTTIIESDLNPNALLAAADKALYKAKSLGRNTVVAAEDVGVT